MIKKLLVAALWLPLMALAQSYPSPTVKTLNVNPPADGVAQGIVTNQATPSVGSAVGPYLMNYFVGTNNYNITGNNAGVVGIYEQFNSGGTNQKGRSIGMFLNQNHGTASSSGADHIALATQEYTNVADTSGGQEYSYSGATVAASGANVTALVGIEQDMEIDAGATVPARFAIRAVNQGALAASGTDDCAFCVLSSVAGGGFKHAFLLSNAFTQVPLQTTGDWFAADAAMTVGSWANLPNLTVTGNIMNFPNFTVSGAGAVSAASLAVSTPLSVANGGTGNSALGSFNVLLGNGAGGIVGAAPGASGGFLISSGASSNPAFGNTVSTLTATGLITPSTTAGIKGTTAADNANAGSVGELLTNSASGTSLSTGVAANCASVSLTAGDWDVWGTIEFDAGATTTISYLAADINTVSATFNATVGNSQQLVSTFTTGSTNALTTPVVRINVSSTTTAYLIGLSNFATSTMTCKGAINARRVR